MGHMVGLTNGGYKGGTEGTKGLVYGGAGTGGGKGVTRLQPLNYRGRRTMSQTGQRGLIFLDMHEILEKIERFNKVNGRRQQGSQGFAEAANLRAAQQLQQLMVTFRQKGSVASRRRVSTGRLDTALGAEGNRYVTSTQLGVGVPGYLTEKAPYWRAIEEGTAYFLGRPIYGIFGESLTGAYGGKGIYGAYPLAGERYSGFSQSNRAGRLLPPSGMKALGVKRGQAERGYAPGVTSRGKGGKKRTDNRAAMKGIIDRPIMAQHYLRNAWKAFDPRKVGRKMATEQINILKQTIIASGGSVKKR